MASLYIALISSEHVNYIYRKGMYVGIVNLSVLKMFINLLK